MRGRSRGADLLRSVGAARRRMRTRLHSELVGPEPDPGKVSAADSEGCGSDPEGGNRTGRRGPLMRVALYARVSTTDQTCENQLLELRRYCVARGWTIVKEYVDEGVSGS